MSGPTPIPFGPNANYMSMVSWVMEPVDLARRLVLKWMTHIIPNASTRGGARGYLGLDPGIVMSVPMRKIKTS